MAEDTNLIQAFCQGASEDLRLLADLHASELTPEQMHGLQSLRFPEPLLLDIPDQDFQLAVHVLQTTVQEWPQEPPASMINALATDFASIYLNGSLHAHPSESVWLDDEELTCQQPMFEVREYYQRHGLAAPNWRIMADDHLVNELLFVAHLLEQASDSPAQQPLLQETTRFMDEHLLRWLLPFGRRVAQRCATPFYASLALLTALYAEHIRNLLADILEVPRESHETIEARLKAQRISAATPQPMQYFPGAAPSW